MYIAIDRLLSGVYHTIPTNYIITHSFKENYLIYLKSQKQKLNKKSILFDNKMIGKFQEWSASKKKARKRPVFLGGKCQH